jgi:hypothetical protein
MTKVIDVKRIFFLWTGHLVTYKRIFQSLQSANVNELELSDCMTFHCCLRNIQFPVKAIKTNKNTLR